MSLWCSSILSGFPDHSVHIFGFGREYAGVLQLDSMVEVDAVLLGGPIC